MGLARNLFPFPDATCVWGFLKPFSEALGAGCNQADHSFTKSLDSGFVWDALDGDDPASGRGWARCDLWSSLPASLLWDAMFQSCCPWQTSLSINLVAHGEPAGLTSFVLLLQARLHAVVKAHLPLC